jgi:hypothetical protein
MKLITLVFGMVLIVVAGVAAAQAPAQNCFPKAERHATNVGLSGNL